MDGGHLNYSTMASLMIHDPVAMYQSPEGRYLKNRCANSPLSAVLTLACDLCRDLSRAIDCALSGQELPFAQKPRYVVLVM
jgi:hypothetical protein